MMGRPSGFPSPAKRCKMAHAAAMRSAELLLTPKHEAPAWMGDPTLLPKVPPHRAKEGA